MLSALQKKRLSYKPLVPTLLQDLDSVCFTESASSHLPKENLRKLLPKTFDAPTYKLIKGKGQKRALKIGVVFSGGPASGGHNVIAGIFDAGATLIGFLDGPKGIVENRFKELQNIESYRNQGGFDLIGSGRTKIEKEEQFLACVKTANSHNLDGLVIIGGDDSNTNAALLAEFFLKHDCKTRVVGVPKTIDGDLRSVDIEMSFGFDSACKTYAEIIGNIAKDALSSKKYYHFIKLMGRSASHITLECALLTHPNLTLIGEERKSLRAIVQEIADLICKRAEVGKEFGVILLPEGLIEFVPEMGELTKDLKLEKDPHGNIQLSQIQTEKILIDLVKKELGRSFNTQEHFLGYEGRACMPTNFDANYCYTLGLLAFLAIREGLTGVICSVQNIKEHPTKWSMKMVPIVQLMHLEVRLGKEKPVIEKMLVDLQGRAFGAFASRREGWKVEDDYACPGPIQFFGESELTDSVPLTLSF